MNVMERMQAPTPKFFRVLRTVGVALAAAGGALLVAPAALPAGVLAVAGYLAIAGSVMTAVSQAAVDQPDSAEMDAWKTEIKKEADASVE